MHEAASSASWWPPRAPKHPLHFSRVVPGDFLSDPPATKRRENGGGWPQLAPHSLMARDRVSICSSVARLPVASVLCASWNSSCTLLRLPDDASSWHIISAALGAVLTAGRLAQHLKNSLETQRWCKGAQ